MIDSLAEDEARQYAKPPATGFKKVLLPSLRDRNRNLDYEKIVI